MINKVFLAHNFYRHEGGEDSVYRNEKELLISNNVNVISYEKHNNDIPDKKTSDLIPHLFSMSWNKGVYKEISKILRENKPDVAHFHNTFQLISPSAYAACHDNGVPVIQTLHNFRLICPGGLLQRDGEPCEKCIGHMPLGSVLHGCYRNSRLSSAAVTLMLIRNRYNKSYTDNVDRYIALTDFSTKKFTAGGIPDEKIMVKPNFIPDPPPPGKGDGGYMVYIGRLSEEKGMQTLISAWEKTPTIPLYIIGDGPLSGLVKAASDDNNNKISWLGFKDKKEVFNYVSNAALLILPSICYEGFPLTILEAYACGTPVLVSRLGNMNEVVIEGETGFKFTPGDASDLSTKASFLWENIENLKKLRPNVYKHHISNYSADRNFTQLLDIYRSAIDSYNKSKTIS